MKLGKFGMIHLAIGDTSEGVDSQARTISGVANTAKFNRYDLVLAADGWQLDNYLANPVVLWMHKLSQPPVAKALRVWVENDELRFIAQFPPKGQDQFADTIFAFYEQGYLRGFSVGFEPLEAEPITEVVDGRTAIIGTRVLKQELQEISCVTVPADPWALTRMTLALGNQDQGTQFQLEGIDMDFLKTLAALLGLNPEATEAQVTQAVEQLLSARASVNTQLGLAETGSDTDAVIQAIKGLAATPAGMPAALLTALGLEAGASEATVLGAIKGLQAGSGQAGELGARVAELEKAAAKRTADDLVDRALAQGKIAPTQKKWALDFATKDAEGFEGFLQTAPQVVPTTRLNGGGLPSSGGAGGEGVEQGEINKELGISEEDFKKYAPPHKEV